MTAIPDTGTWYNGSLNTDSQQYDVLVSARGNIVTEENPKVDLIITPYDIPDFFTADNGKLLIAEPKPMGTITMLEGHNAWVRIEILKNEIKSNISQYVCLGIRRQGEEEYTDVLHTKERVGCIAMMSREVFELVPFLSSTEVNDYPSDMCYWPGWDSPYTPIKAGTIYPSDDAELKPSGSAFNFGTAFRVSVTSAASSWNKCNRCDLVGWAWPWEFYGSLGVGPVTDRSGVEYDDQLLIFFSKTGMVARSSDGIHWISDFNSVEEKGTGWVIGPVYGNGTWCAVSRNEKATRRSIDGGKTWTESDLVIQGQSLAFAEEIFMTVDINFNVYTSYNAASWSKIGVIPAESLDNAWGGLCYGNGKWIFGCNNEIFSSGNGIEWIKENSCNINELYSYTLPLHSICYANGYFYAGSGCTIRSSDGVKWEKFSVSNESSCFNMTYHKNKLYYFGIAGETYTAVIFNPDGTLDPDPDLQA